MPTRVARASLKADATALPGERTKPRLVNAASDKLDRHRQLNAPFVDRYRTGKNLGEGSMGAVTEVHDGTVGRDIALKRLHAEHEKKRPDLRDRFLREARVQGQLEHPSVVPVYDIGIDPEGHAYFTMKRVRGHTLEEVVDGLRDGDENITRRFSLRKLLTAMSRICLAVSFAHERGVVHRDLKPANVMLGDYGEVHLLDWGIAKVAGLDDPTFSEHLDVGQDGAQRTEAGFVVGTPGYMAPEQARGETGTYGGRSDIYSLGAILFEVCTLERLHNSSAIGDILLSTVSGVDARPGARARGKRLPQELDGICQRATAMNPELRFGDAREMNEAIEGVLDRTRDMARGQDLANQHTNAAKDALRMASRGGEEANGQHRRAVGEILQALALEPNHKEARSTMVRLLLDPLEQLPSEAFEELQATDRHDRARASRANVYAYLCWLAAVPVVYWMGIKDWLTLSMLGLGGAALIAYTSWMASTRNTHPRYMIVAVLLTFGCVAFMSAFFGPLFFVPGISVAVATTYLVSLRANRRARWVVLGGSVSAVLLPALLQLTGLIDSRYIFEAGSMQILPGATQLPGAATTTFLLLSGVLTVVIANILVGRAVTRLLQAERRLFVQAWRLRQFLPNVSEAREQGRPTPSQSFQTQQADQHR